VNTLEQIVESVRQDLDEKKRLLPFAELEAQIDGSHSGRPFCEAIATPGVSVIAEYKRSSPSAGQIRADLEVEDVVTQYQEGGAAALSVLTEPSFFGGEIGDLKRARGSSTLPVLRKDFVVDRYQLYESVLAGADAVLLIVAALSPNSLKQLYLEAQELDLDVLVEVHSAEELDTALDIDVDVIGINNRDLTDLSVNIETTFELLAEVPTGKTIVSESGFSEREQIEELERVGVDAVLIGETLMRAAAPGEQLKVLKGMSSI